MSYSLLKFHSLMTSPNPSCRRGMWVGRVPLLQEGFGEVTTDCFMQVLLLFISISPPKLGAC